MCDQYYDDYQDAHRVLDEESFDFLNQELKDKIDKTLCEGDYLRVAYKNKVETIDKLCSILDDNGIRYGSVNL